MAQVLADTSTSSLHSLVTQSLVDTKKYYCPFLERGFCREQSRCNFSHDCHISKRIPTDYCHFYLANQCLYGQECKFLHDEPGDGHADSTLLSGDSSNIQSFHDATSSGSLVVLAAENSAAGSSSNQEKENDDEEVQDYDHDGAQGNADDFAPANKGCLGPSGDCNQNDQNHANDSSYYRFNLDELFQSVNGFRYNSNGGHSEQHQAQQWFDADDINQPSSSSGSSSHHHHHHHHQNNRRHENNNNMPKMTTISHRCSVALPSTSELLAKLHPPTNSAAQTSTSSTTTNPTTNSNDKVAPAPSKSSSWQGARLIASIRNNFGPSDLGSGGSGASGSSNTNCDNGAKDYPLCPYSLAGGECPLPEGRCNYLHGDICDLCYCACLHPYNEEQRFQHREECLREHERQMELSFAVQRSKDKVCGICMDTVVEKKPITASRFGILEKCNHIFCLDCIRKWRGTKQFDSRTIRACPECRVSSDFVVPSKYWVEDQDDKERLIRNYKAALRSKPCRYFMAGKGDCPFAGSCFYKHAYPDGRLAVMEAPKPRRRLYGARGATSSVNYLLWNILTSTEDDLSNDELESLYEWDDLRDDNVESDQDDYWG